MLDSAIEISFSAREMGQGYRPHSLQSAVTSCTNRLQSENLVPLSVTRTYVSTLMSVCSPANTTRASSDPLQSMHTAPCVTACPTTAMFKRADGIVRFRQVNLHRAAKHGPLVRRRHFFNPRSAQLEMLTFALTRIDMVLEPRVWVFVPTQAILIGDMNDSDSYVAQIVSREPLTVRLLRRNLCPAVSTKGRSRRRSIHVARAASRSRPSCEAEQQQGRAH